MITLNEILTALGCNPQSSKNTLITETVIDSRKAIPGSLFIALKGERSDGHAHIKDAFMNGAQIALIHEDLSPELRVLDLQEKTSIETLEIPPTPFCIRVNDTLTSMQEIARWWRERLPLRVVGITGSVGKSSTKELVSELLNRRFRTFKNPGNYNNEIGLPLTILNIGHGYERLVLEMGFYYPGEIQFLCGIAKPVIGVVTNIGTVHAERAGSVETITKGKSELIQALPKAPAGTAILNYDDPRVMSMAEITDAKIITYGLNPEADFWADEINGQGLKGIRFRLHHKEKSMVLQVPMLGRHSVQTVLRSTAVCFSEDLEWDEIREGLTQNTTQLRLIAVQTRNGALILDDTYNATPESTIAALDLLSEIKGQKIAVLGDMLELGQYERAGHEMVGYKAAEVAQYLIAVGQRGRTIAETAKSGGLPATSITWVENALQATEILKYNLKEGDVVLIKGSHGLRLDRISAALEEVL